MCSTTASAKRRMTDGDSGRPPTPTRPFLAELLHALLHPRVRDGPARATASRPERRAPPRACNPCRRLGDGTAQRWVGVAGPPRALQMSSGLPPAPARQTRATIGGPQVFGPQLAARAASHSRRPSGPSSSTSACGRAGGPPLRLRCRDHRRRNREQTSPPARTARGTNARVAVVGPLEIVDEATDQAPTTCSTSRAAAIESSGNSGAPQGPRATREVRHPRTGVARARRLLATAPARCRAAAAPQQRSFLPSPALADDHQRTVRPSMWAMNGRDFGGAPQQPGPPPESTAVSMAANRPYGRAPIGRMLANAPRDDRQPCGRPHLQDRGSVMSAATTTAVRSTSDTSTRAPTRSRAGPRQDPSVGVAHQHGRPPTSANGRVRPSSARRAGCRTSTCSASATSQGWTLDCPSSARWTSTFGILILLWADAGCRCCTSRSGVWSPRCFRPPQPAKVLWEGSVRARRQLRGGDVAGS